MLFALALALVPQAQAARLEDWTWQAKLTTPGGPLRFQLAFEHPEAEVWRGYLINGEERIAIPGVAFDGRELRLDMPHYDSRIRARRVEGSSRFEGAWEKRRSATNVASLPFEAHPPAPDEGRSGPTRREFLGRWRADFAEDEQDSVAVFAAGPRSGLRGTFLTSTGDYRYLAGRAPGDELELACFDGAHAFLFRAKLREDGTLAGDFWSGDWHHETWTARRDDAAELADPFAQTTWNGKTRLADLVFPDLDGKRHSLGEFAGQATLLVVLGSWCPNCNDEAQLLKELDAQYRARGLRILGLAFELTGEPARDAEQVRIFQRRHGLEAVPFFLCGTADKAEATKALGLVDRVRAFPTTIFVGADGLPKAIHSGYAGPATGEEHQKLRRDFEARLAALLGGK